jgi:hypothetical protein
MFEVVLSPEASDFYANAELPLARKLARCFAQLEREPRRHNNIKRLTGQFAGYLRYRVAIGELSTALSTKPSRYMFYRLLIAAIFMNKSALPNAKLQLFS